MNKQELVSVLSENINKNRKDKISKKDMAMIVDNLFDSIQKELKKEGKFNSVGFGTFGSENQSGRRGRNPQTGKRDSNPFHKGTIFPSW